MFDELNSKWSIANRSDSAKPQIIIRGQMTRPNVILHTFDSAMVAAWRKAFDGAPGVVVVEGDILEGGCDAVVSPANSFGFMDGGIDLAYRRYFGLDLQSRVQAKIRSEFHGELPVGQAIVVPTDHKTVPYLVLAPTMRIPDKIGDTVNVYLAFRAALLAVLTHNNGSTTSIKSLRAPALGTGIGSMPLGRAAHQMHAAYVSVFEDPEWLKDPTAILLHHENLRSA
jgi:O-acetyl-ADP-ribose deacetylase (regulator of RNase III)